MHIYLIAIHSLYSIFGISLRFCIYKFILISKFANPSKHNFISIH